MRGKLANNRRLAFLALIVLGLVAVLAGLRWQNHGYPSPVKIDKFGLPVSTSSVARTGLTHIAGICTNAQASAASCERVRVLTKDLLLSPPGHITGKHAWECLAELKELKDSAKTVLDELVKSTNVNERLLGVFLSLEVFGPTASVLDLAVHDAAPVVTAEVGQWLYLNARFDQWDEFLNRVAKGMKPEQMETLLNQCDRVPVSVEVPAGMSILTVGRGLPQLMQETALRNDALAHEMKNRVLDPNLDFHRRLSLLDVMQNARPDGYIATLTNIVSQSIEYSPVRGKAIFDLGEVCDDKESIDFMRRSAANSNDTLAVAMAQEAAMAEKRMMAGGAVLRETEKMLEEATTDAAQKTNLPMLLGFYIEMVKKDRKYSPNLKILNLARDEFKRREFLNYQQRQRLADVEHLLWLSARH